ncbi:MAG: hypothetical protein LKE28_07140 [Sphaerochaeta sp.]|jgi:beta-galactosidase/beta-glucuronidase|nr:hypothetical protein [Sphaerochaeta sp.]
MATIERSGYPFPDRERDTWSSLDGMWTFETDDRDVGLQKEYGEKGVPSSTQILVPFAPQSQRSGINDASYHPILWYERRFAAPKTSQHVFLCFAAVDWHADVWVNGRYIGSHDGGYTPFSFDITLWLQDDNRLTVRVFDSNDTAQPRGKQYWGEHGDRCWYIPSSGIWQTVWLESRPQIFIEGVATQTDVDHELVETTVLASSELDGTYEVHANVFWNGQQLLHTAVTAQGRENRFVFPLKPLDAIDPVHFWSPETPNLFDMEVLLVKEGIVCDKIRTYFGMRKISVEQGRVLLNNRPLYQKLILDQGYWPEGLLTVDDDEAIKRDILLVKQMGFNGVRMHQKIECSRFLYWADKLGLLVWEELPSAYQFSTTMKQDMFDLLQETIKRDKNHPSIICWVLLNESWGVRDIYANEAQQRFAVALYHMAKSLDPTRLVDSNDGWDNVTSDLCTIHDYAKNGNGWKETSHLVQGSLQGRSRYAKGYAYGGQPVLITEFGGIALTKDLHDGNWGYEKGEPNVLSFTERFSQLLQSITSNPDIQGFCYTQLTDVMQEVNGLLDEQRNPKIPVEEIRRLLQGNNEL